MSDSATHTESHDHHSVHAASAPGSAQIINTNQITTPALVALVLVMGVALFVSGLAMSTANRALSAVAEVSQAGVNAAVAADRADRAERRANISEAYAKQVYVELNRLGYPVHSPIEEHSQAPAEATK